MFNTEAFIASIIFFTIGFIQVLAYSSICRNWNIKIDEFFVFSGFNFPVFKRTIGHTKYTLGWFPMSFGISAIGATEDEYNELDEFEKPNALYSKTSFQKTVFHSAPFVSTLLIVIVLSLLAGGPAKTIHFIIDSFKAMFGSTPKEEYGEIVSEMVKTHGLYTFVLLSGLLLTLFSYFTTLIQGLLSGNNKLKALIWLPLLASGFMFFILIWKIPSLASNYFSVKEITFSILSYYAGMFVAGIIAYFTTVYLAKVKHDNFSG